MTNQTAATERAAEKLTVILRIPENRTYMSESAMRKQVESDLSKLSLSTLRGLETLIACK